MNAAMQSKQKKVPKPKKYNAFVRQIEISNVRMLSSRVDLLDYSYFPSSAEVNFRVAESYENAGEQFNVFHKYKLTITDRETKEAKAKISVTFCVAYNSPIPMSDDIFEVFKKGNLMLNTWPYLREFVHNTVGRMGWALLIVPSHAV